MKNLKTLVILCLVFVVALLFVSCENSDGDDIYNDEYAKLLPVKISDNNGVTEYTYNRYNELIAIRNTEILRPEQSRIAQETNYKITYKFYDLINGERSNRMTIARTLIDSLIVSKKNVGGTLVTYRDTLVLKYTNNGRNIYAENKHRSIAVELSESEQVVRYEHVDKQAESRTVKLYEYDSKMNVSKIDDSQNGNLSYYTYRYDVNKGVFGRVRMPQWFLVTQQAWGVTYINNCLEEQCNGRRENVNTYVFSKNGYPLVCETKYVGMGYISNPVIVTKFEYIRVKDPNLY